MRLKAECFKNYDTRFVFIQILKCEIEENKTESQTSFT